MWKEAVTAYCSVLPQYLPAEFEENHKYHHDKWQEFSHKTKQS
jgi:hypothetical protein